MLGDEQPYISNRFQLYLVTAQKMDSGHVRTWLMMTFQDLLVLTFTLIFQHLQHFSSLSLFQIWRRSARYRFARALSSSSSSRSTTAATVTMKRMLSLWVRVKILLIAILMNVWSQNLRRTMRCARCDYKSTRHKIGGGIGARPAGTHIRCPAQQILRSHSGIESQVLRTYSPARNL
jgi:hypothetical protein